MTENARLTGQIFHRWTVLEDYELTPKGERKWHCRCTCGKERYVLERSLKSGGSVSCGCLRKERVSQSRTPDLTGKQFGDLTVLQKLEPTRGPVKWLCQCACGETCQVAGTLLVTGRKTRCSGKAHEKHYAYTDITGQKFGRLTALHPARRYDKSGSVIWHCRCDCGREVEASYNSLLYANKRSCGCKRKEHGEKLATYLTHVAGTSIDILKSKKLPSDNTTGHKGVYLVKGKYLAKIVFQKKQYCLGTYTKIEDAVQARTKAEQLLFDGFSEYYENWQKQAEADPEWARQNPIQVDVIRNGQELQLRLMPFL